ncbi:hypothetical protein [Rhodohalobacter sp. 614A]|uniref:hypothetical protein n=1 Tax=Rhodohalobacter sp. 614A TaxID=2908649 RepID=UPI001F3A1377|nr:hypothetical protein [Rhodohalobacter sp. 614A]
MSKLLIHIGTWKTGSSTIQYNLYTLREKLEEEGFYYLCKENKMVDQDGIVREFTKLEDKFIQKSRKKFKKILEDKRGKNKDINFISSAEEFSGNPFYGFKNAKAVAQNLFEITKDLGLDISVIVYLRRQDDFFESLYQQSIRLGETHSFEDFLNQFDSSDFNWYSLLQGYADVFGKEKIIVRRYHKKYLPETNSLIQDFGKVIGSDILANFEETTSKNKGFSRDTMEITRIMNKYFEGEERLQLRKIYDQVNAKYPFEEYSFFTENERSVFLERYLESNSAVAREYLAEETLFPQPKYNSTNNQYNGLTLEAVIVNFSKALLLVKEDSENEKRKLAKKLKKYFLRFQAKKTFSENLNKFPGLKKSLKGLFGK